ncbi:MopE-related protein, partial [Limnovirga soli]
YGSPNNPVQAKCFQPQNTVTNNLDCDDQNASVHPGAPELCDGLDNDCDGQIDEDFPLITYYFDVDGDGYGSPNNPIQARCFQPQNTVTNNLDCDDQNASVHPGAPELCDGLDNDCDGQIDEDFPLVTYYFDVDGDGYGSPNNPVQARCFQPQNTVTNNLDCDDQNASVHPGAPELCDGLDNDCDGQIDEDFPLITYYFDVDGDGYGNPNSPIQARCFVPIGTVSNNLDCDDNNAAIHPGATEICGNGIDDNCNGQIDENCTNNIRFTIADKAKLEGNGPRTISFIVKLSKASTQTVQVSYATQNSTALAGPDYTAKTGTLTFAPGVRKQTINVTINGDRIVEPDETFRILLSNPVNAALPDGEAIGTIINDDATAVAATVEPTTTAAKSVIVTTGLKVSPNPATTTLYVQLTGYKGNVTLQLR